MKMTTFIKLCGIGAAPALASVLVSAQSHPAHTPHPDEAFMLQIGRQMTDPVDGIVGHRGMLICDRDRK